MRWTCLLPLLALTCIPKVLIAQCHFEGSFNIDLQAYQGGSFLEMRDGYIYQRDGANGLMVIDARDPLSPSIATRLSEFDLGQSGLTRFQLQSCIIEGDRIYARGLVYSAIGQTNFGLGIAILDRSDPASPVKLLSRPVFPAAGASGGSGGGIAKLGDQLFVTTGAGVLKASVDEISKLPLNLPIPFSSVLVGIFIDIVVDDQSQVAYASRAAGASGTGQLIYVLDVADPSATKVLSAIPISHPRQLAISHNRLYAICNNQARAFDTSDPSIPNQIWLWTGGTYTYLTDVAATDSFVIYADGDRAGRARMFNRDGRHLDSLAGVDCYGAGCGHPIAGGYGIAIGDNTVAMASASWQGDFWSWDGASVTTIDSCLPTCVGDANGDNIANFTDITEVLANWLGAGPNGDADDNGVVDFADINSVLANWLFACNQIE